MTAPDVPRTARRDVLLVLVGALVTGTSSTLMQLSATTSTTAAFYRCVYALPVLAVLGIRERRRGSKLGRRDVLRAVMAGVFLAVDLIIWFGAIRELGAGPTTVVQDTQVVFVALAAWAVLGERPARRLVALVPVLAFGTVLISGLAGGSATGTDPLRGTILAVVSAAAYAGFVLLLGSSEGSARSPGAFLSVATLATAATAFAVGGASGDLRLAPTWPGHGWLLLLALTTQVLGWLVISVAMARVTRLQASVGLLLQPAAAVVAAWVLLDDTLTVTQLAGVAVVVLAAAATALAGPSRRGADGGAPLPDRRPPVPPADQASPADHGVCPRAVPGGAGGSAQQIA